jgi:hypothetical protein
MPQRGRARRSDMRLDRLEPRRLTRVSSTAPRLHSIRGSVQVARCRFRMDGLGQEGRKDVVQARRPLLVHLHGGAGSAFAVVTVPPRMLPSAGRMLLGLRIWPSRHTRPLPRVRRGAGGESGDCRITRVGRCAPAADRPHVIPRVFSPDPTRAASVVQRACRGYAAPRRWIRRTSRRSNPNGCARRFAPDDA